MYRNVRFALLAALVSLLRPAPCRAEAVFDFRVDRFEVQSAGGFFFADEFDHPNLGEWYPLYGTASVADGFLHLTNPGTAVPNGLGVLPGRTLDLSLVESAGEVHDAGDFVARSYWQPDTLVPGDFNYMSFNTASGAGDQIEVAGIAVANLASAADSPTYTIVQHLVRFTNGVLSPPQLTSVGVDPAAITGQVVFELRFDHAAKLLETAFSLDGGVTFDRPFSPLPIFAGTSYGYFVLGADPETDTVRTTAPPPPLCAIGALDGEAMLTSRDASAGGTSLKGSLFFGPGRGRAYDPRRVGMQIRITDRTQDSPILDLTPPRALRGGPGCGDQDGWHRARKGFVYRNFTNALPPDCMPGSAGGVTRVRLKHRAPLSQHGKRRLPRRLGFQVDLATPWRPAPGARIATTVVLGDRPDPGITCATLEVSCLPDGAGIRCE